MIFGLSRASPPVSYTHLQALCLLAGLARHKGAGVVAVPAPVKRAGVDADDIPLADHLRGAGDAVDDRVVDRNAGRGGKAVQPQKIRRGALADNIVCLLYTSRCV